MMDRDLLRKLEDERSLTPDEWLRLDDALDSTDARFAQTLVRSLESEEPSLAWRSDLNSRLAQTSKAQRQRRLALRWLPIMAAPVAAGCAFLVMMTSANRPNNPGFTVSSSKPPVVQTQESIEERMMDFHRDALTPLAVGANMPYERAPDLPDTRF
jgi:hypothetical protein